MNGFEDLFGIDTMAEGTWAEMSIGNSSVVVPCYKSDGYSQEKFTPVTFAFDEEKPKFRVHGICKKDHKHTEPTGPKPKPKKSQG